MLGVLRVAVQMQTGTHDLTKVKVDNTCLTIMLVSSRWPLFDLLMKFKRTTVSGHTAQRGTVADSFDRPNLKLM